MESLYTVEDASKILKVTKETIRSLIKSGKLGAFKINTRYRIKESDVLKFSEEFKNANKDTCKTPECPKL